MKLSNLEMLAINLKNYYYKTLGYPCSYNARALINKFCDNNIFRFGKYKGETIASVIIDDYQYIKWCEENIKHFNLTKKEQALLYAFSQGHKIHGDKMVITSNNVDIEFADNNDVDYNLLKQLV